MRAFIRQLGPAVLGVAVFTVLCGLIYPLVVTGVAQVAFHDKANGSLVKVDGQVVGSRLIGQQFADAKYFHPRPSAAGSGYDGLASSASNLGPTNPDFLASIDDRVAAYRQENGLPSTQLVPVDAVTASGSGLDPDISVANAKLQADRVAAARGKTVADVLALVDAHTSGRQWAIFGEPGVNVLELNLALDAAHPVGK
jgi:potassium-transporting ATPase KdpC subunit